MKISFDIGGVLSKYPKILKPLLRACQNSNEVEVFIISDMHIKTEIIDMLAENSIYIDASNVYSANFEKYGEACKAVLLKELGIDIHIDDFPAYLAEGCPLRLLVMPDIRRPYYAESWKAPNLKEGNEFGRRKRCKAFINKDRGLSE